MMKNHAITLAATLTTLTFLTMLVADCAPAILTSTHQLIFQPDVFHEASGEFVISPQVRKTEF